ncbi:N-acetylmuramoyl-L-alanine amidase [Amylibacter sp. IMCC11727]|uniref:N-acetylmuramoyl-L-alanine amidase n=1 Tax=Amylibacter sp. IMCC11727 TaxID=3039851 RepID=UPI00244DC9CF|nr:N-acetylmuramoyl-L-alanine amidase [Amylibacter sp. IMCC11727]WGI22990.1 N-acetylmuramoyl-L-alanine amidase [Amylibacter sp. IMCC11727]
MSSSPNCGPRKHGLPPDMVVLHYTAMETAEAAIERLCDPAAEVSAHYVIAEDGAVTQLVADGDRAWHAGAGQWGWVTDVNSHSIGFELANQGPDSDAPQFPDAQMAALERELARVMRTFDIPPERVIGHSDMAPGRKVDPGPYFDWKRLAGKGLSVWVHSAAPATDKVHRSAFRTAAFYFGYRPADQSDESWQIVLDAFRLRFRPDGAGPLDAVDVGIITRLAEKWPCQPVDPGMPIEVQT